MIPYDYRIVTHQLKTHKKSAENEFLLLLDLDRWESKL